MQYNLFVDESGDHGLSNLNPDFPIFLLCGIIISENECKNLNTGFDEIKQTIWNSKHVIFHSRDIRKCEKEFKYLFDLNLKANFYKMLDEVISISNYSVVASAIDKYNYIQLYGKLSNDVYEISLSFIIESAIFYLNSLNDTNASLDIIIEKRGKKEDKKLDEHFQRLMARGTGEITAQELSKYKLTIYFKNKKENINGLQLADLIAYPLAKYTMDPDRINPAFSVFEHKIHQKQGERYGLRIFP